MTATGNASEDHENTPGEALPFGLEEGGRLHSFRDQNKDLFAEHRAEKAGLWIGGRTASRWKSRALRIVTWLALYAAMTAALVGLAIAFA